MLEFTHIGDLTSDDVERMRAIYQPLAESVRELIDATIRTEVDADEVAAVKAEIDAATARLRAQQIDGAVRRALHHRRGPDGVGKPGHRDPQSDRAAAGDRARRVRRRRSPTSISARAYEGPPGHVHGGVAAMVLDHVLGEAASDGINPRFTGTITMRYLRTTRLGRLHAEARIVRTEGVKTYVVGHLADDEGVTVEAEGVFIQPKWARG